MRMQLVPALCLALAAGAAGAQSARLLDPKGVCRALSSEGFGAGALGHNTEGFEDTGFSTYKCLSDGVVIPGGSGTFVTSLNYFAESRTADRVEIVKLVLNVHNRKTRDAGRTKFIASIKSLLQALAIDPPAALLAALDKSTAGTFPIDGGRIRFEVWSLPVERQRLTI
jgi:hypothetical protein